MSDILLELSTHIREPKKFLVDGKEYQLLGLDHLGQADEVNVMALFARHTILAAELADSKEVKTGERVATRLKETRLSLLTKLTDLPLDIARKLPITAQVRLLETLEREVSEEPDAEDAEDEAGAAAEPINED